MKILNEKLFNRNMPDKIPNGADKNRSLWIFSDGTILLSDLLR